MHLQVEGQPILLQQRILCREYCVRKIVPLRDPRPRRAVLHRSLAWLQWPVPVEDPAHAPNQWTRCDASLQDALKIWGAGVRSGNNAPEPWAAPGRVQPLNPLDFLLKVVRNDLHMHGFHHIQPRKVLCIVFGEIRLQLWVRLQERGMLLGIPNRVQKMEMRINHVKLEDKWVLGTNATSH